MPHGHSKALGPPASPAAQAAHPAGASPGPRQRPPAAQGSSCPAPACPTAPRCAWRSRFLRHISPSATKSTNLLPCAAASRRGHRPCAHLRLKEFRVGTVDRGKGAAFPTPLRVSGRGTSAGHGSSRDINPQSRDIETPAAASHTKPMSHVQHHGPVPRATPACGWSVASAISHSTQHTGLFL